jgi:hypothetical protein
MKKYPENRRPNVQCVLCATPMYRRPWILAKGKGKYCSHACRNKAYPLPDGRNFPPPKRGADNPAWKGGVTYWRKKGNYKPIKYVRCPQDFLPMARKDGYIMEHRLIVAQMMGRHLTRTEVVHHRNHDPQDNRPENLELFPDNGTHKRTEWARVKAAAASLTGRDGGQL